MAFQKINRAIGGITPLGEFTITPGTPQNILANAALSTTRYAFQCRQLGFSVTKASTSEVYVNYGNNAGLGNQTALIVQPGQEQSLPISSRAVDSEIDATQWYVDCAAGGTATVVVYALDATS
jgi:hypothetical protein